MKARLFAGSVRSLAIVTLMVQLMPLLVVSGAPLTKARPGKIKGQVADVNQARVVKALVSVNGIENRWLLVTNDKGEFEIPLPAGAYRITITANGFRRFVSDEVKVKPGKTQTIRIQLEVASLVMPVPATLPAG